MVDQTPTESTPELIEPERPLGEMVPPTVSGAPWRTIAVGVVALIVGILIAVVVLSAKHGGGPASAITGPRTHDLTGSLTASECGGGYDIESAAVTVRDGANKIIGATTTSFNSGAGANCVVDFTVSGVAEADFYQIEIGTHGGPSYTLEEMKANDWRVDLSLG